MMVNVPMTTTDCWCGLPFSMPTRFYKECKMSGGTFYCPLGHAMIFGHSDNDQLRRECDRLKQRLAQKNDTISQAERSVAALKGHVTKLKNRAVAGVCPCCDWQFQNVRKHMKVKHPGFKDEPADDGLKVIAGGKS